MSPTLDRLKLLAELGYGHPEASGRAVAVLAEAGLTNPRKTGIASEKRKRVVRALEGALVRVCARCAKGGAGDGREPVPVDDDTDCEICRGSANRIAVQRAVKACKAGGVRCLVVVGGAPGVHTELKKLWPRRPELRIVPGTGRHTGKQARANLDWADLAVVWATTELDHKVSLLYTKERSDKVITAGRRGIAALADRITARLRDGT